jgi:membrane protease YdiL (CAAX protease family)
LLKASGSTPSTRSDRPLQIALFLISVVWFFLSQSLAGRAATGLSVRFDLSDERPLLSVLFLLFLLTLGFSFLQSLVERNAPLHEVLGLPERPTAGREWVIGAALGWGLVVLAVLPMALGGTLHVQFWWSLRSFWLVLLYLTTLAVSALVEEIAFRGYPFRRLIQAMGPTGATVVMSLFFGLLHAFNPDATWISVLITMFAGVLLSLAWLRTHGLWLGWGLHFAWNASMGILFGLPVSGIVDFSSVVQTRAMGAHWLTGGNYGPEGALLTLPVLVAGIIALTLLTDEYAWQYTRRPIVAAGYPMDAPPTEAHGAVEQSDKPASLVQILPAAPDGPADKQE